MASRPTAPRCPRPYPHLTSAAAYDAISFYYDHQAAIDRFIAENTLETHTERYRFTVADSRRHFNGR